VAWRAVRRVARPPGGWTWRLVGAQQERQPPPSPPHAVHLLRGHVLALRADHALRPLQLVAQPLQLGPLCPMQLGGVLQLRVQHALVFAAHAAVLLGAGQLEPEDGGLLAPAQQLHAQLAVARQRALALQLDPLDVLRREAVRASKG
jgi:hypothetical protein